MIENFINKKDSLRNLTDDEFQKILPKLANILEKNGFPKFLYNENDLNRDWNKLQFYNTDKKEINATTTVGTKIIKHYMPNLNRVKNYKGISLEDLWIKDKIIKALMFNRKQHNTPYMSEIVRSIGFTNGLTRVTIYRPALARKVIKETNSKTVLDCCVGWGGRLLGACSLEGISYVGIEPDTETYNNLVKIVKFLKLEDKVTLINKPAEEAIKDLQKDKKTFDIALTSPPFYNLEIYSNEDTQSIKKYNTYETWLDNFIKPVITYITKNCKISAWSIKNFKSDKKYNLFDDITHIHEQLNWKLTEDEDKKFIMQNSKRPGAGKNTEKTKEITYCYIKNEN